MSTVHHEVADDIDQEQRERRRRRSQVGMAVFVTIIGLVSFFGVAGKPRFATYHPLDVARLIIAGVGFGVALVLLFQPFKSSGSGSGAKKE